MNDKKYIFTKDEIKKVQTQLLRWYHKNKRDLPWRQLSHLNQNQHAYSVWVSEIMLQQTRVSTVIAYYNRWMEKWPTVSHLAKACEDEVNQMWAGLGYYSRGRRLLEGAQKIMDSLDGVIPTDAASLMKQIPGVGRYTACAIASIAFNEAVGVVDGNVIRVLCRLRTIGGNTSSKNVNLHLWSQSNEICDRKHPGDFNQALMELGATVCTPKNPDCSSCPVKFCCKAFAQVEFHNNEAKLKLLPSEQTKRTDEKSLTLDAETTKTLNVKNEDKVEIADIENCANSLALTYWDPKLGVENYPQKFDKKPPRLESCVVLIIQLLEDKLEAQEGDVLSNDSRFLVSKRPKSGLLANLWEFPTHSSDSLQPVKLPIKKRKRSDATGTTTVEKKLVQELASDILSRVMLQTHSIKRLKFAGKYLHKFSHIHLTNCIYSVQVVVCDPDVCVAPAQLNYRWVNLKEFKELAKPTLTVNIFDIFCSFSSDKSDNGEPRKVSKQASIKSFFHKK